MIEARGLARAFGARRVVRDVSVAVAPGEVVGLLGPNGAGKTTTLRLLLGLLRPHAGEAHVDGRVGYLPEAFAAYDALSVRSYLRFLARLKRVASSEVERAMEATAVTDLARRPVGRLSKGQRQRVGLAQALLGRPPAYVLDEPTQSLDPAQAVDARVLVRSLAGDGAAVLLSTHVLAEAAAGCDRVVVLDAGRVVGEERIRPARGAGEARGGEAGGGMTAEELEARFLRLVGRAPGADAGDAPG